jgi:hypothetical protein
MNGQEFVIVVLIMVFAFSLVKRRIGVRHIWEQPAMEENQETHRLRQEVQELKERLKVLERITVDKENSLAKEIESLRDR